MVKNTRAQARPDSLVSINAPTPVKVIETPDGLPKAALLYKQLKVISVQDSWRIDDEWWREYPVHRSYFQVFLEDGRDMTIFRDDVDSGWYSQHY